MPDNSAIFPPKALIMAPMVDLSHEPYRQLVRFYGGCDLFYSEMLNSRIVPQENSEKSLYLRFHRVDDLVIQLVGNDIERMLEAAVRLEGFEPWGVDVNMGCYLKKVMCHGWGAAFMKTPELAVEMVRALRPVVKRRLSVKLRIGHEPDAGYLIDFAQGLQDAGADFIVLHARTVADGLNRPPRWDYIAKLKDRLSIPVIGNGGIESAADAVRMFERTGCDGVMIGRRALIEPWIFRDIRRALDGAPALPKPEVRETFERLMQELDAFFPRDVAIKRFKQALPWLAANFRYAHHFVKEIQRAITLKDAEHLLAQSFADGMQ